MNKRSRLQIRPFPALQRWVRAIADDHGLSLVELSLGITMLLIILVGAAEYGRLAYYSIEAASAAEAGARYGSQNRTTAVDSAGITQAARNDAHDFPNGILQVTVNSSTCACITSSGIPSGSGSCDTLSCATGTQKAQYVSVQTSGTINTLLHYPGFPSSYSVSGKAQGTVHPQQY